MIDSDDEDEEYDENDDEADVRFCLYIFIWKIVNFNVC
jgi:hypothetical protein